MNVPALTKSVYTEPGKEVWIETRSVDQLLGDEACHVVKGE